MNGLLYVSMNGAENLLAAQAVHSNNLANANTPGFKADLVQMQAIQNVENQDQSLNYSNTAERGVDLNSGALISTGNQLDVAVQEGGFLVVQTEAGNEAYTKRGDFQLSAAGQLINGNGLAVMGNGGPISIPPADKIEIGNDGTISILPKGQASTALVTIDRLKLVKANQGELVKGLDGLLHTKDQSALPTDASIKVSSGVIEGSNVNAVGEMVHLISLAREFELNIKMMKLAEENDQSSSTIMRME